MKKILGFIFIFSTLTSQAASKSKYEADSFQVAKLFYSARAAIGENPKFIENPTLVPLTEAEISQQILSWYDKLAGAPLDKKSEAGEIMWQAILNVFKNAKSGGYQSEYAKSEHYPTRFIPARFGTQMTKEFNKLAGAKYKMKWTTNDVYLVNYENEADVWEKNIIKSKFENEKWHQGDAYYEEKIEQNAKSARYMMPEYFKASCLACHGGDAGKKIHKGKFSAGSGTFGGALSLTTSIN